MAHQGQGGPGPLPPSRGHSRQPSHPGLLSLPSICEHEQDPRGLSQDDLAVPALGVRHSRKKSRNNSGEGSVPADFIYTSGGGAGITEDTPDTGAAAAALPSANSGPRRGLANRPRPPSITLYPSQQQLQGPPLHCNTDTRASASASVPISPRCVRVST